MGRTIRRQPVTNNIPTAPKKYYFNITAFKGISRTDNPFNEDTSTCSDALNVYVDEDNALATRPRTEVKYNLTNITNFKKAISLTFIDEKYLLQYYTTDDKAHICWVSTDGTVTPITGEVGTSKIEIRKGKGYYVFVDGVSYKYIDATTNTISQASEHAYVPTTKVGGDLYSNTSGKDFESENILTTKYKKSFGATLETQEEILGVDYFLLKSFSEVPQNYTLTSYNGNTFTTTDINELDTFVDSAKWKASSFAMDSTGKNILAVQTNNAALNAIVDRVIISTDYGKTFSYTGISTEVETGHITVGFAQDNSFAYIATTSNIWISTDNFVTSTKTALTAISGSEFKNQWAMPMTSKSTNKYIVLHAQLRTSDMSENTSRSGICIIDTQNISSPTWQILPFGFLSDGEWDIADDINTDKLIGVWHDLSGDKLFYMSDMQTSLNGTEILTSGIYNAFAFFGVNNEINIVGTNGDTHSFYVYDLTNQTMTQVYTFTNGNVITQRFLKSHNKILFANVYSNYNGVVIYDYFDKNIKIVPDIKATSGNLYCGFASIGNCLFIKNYMSDDYDDGTIWTNRPFAIKEDFLSVLYDSSVHPEKTIINTATHLIDFNNTLFIGGNSNLICHTDVDANTFENNYLYLPMKNRAYIGTNDDKITSFNMLSDTGMLAYTKDNVYIIYYDATNNVYTYNKTKTPYGHISNRNATTTPISDTPIIINNNGIFAFQAVANYQTTDKSSVLISEAINPILFKETQLDKTFMCNHKYWTLLFVPNGDITKVYLLDDRTQQFFYWELYGKVIDAIEIDGDVNLLTEDGYVLTFTTEDIYKQYGALEKTVYYDVYSTESVRIPWEWKSQILPLNTINYLKTLVNTSFMVSDSDESDNYGFSFVLTSFKRRANYNTSEKTLKENLQGIKSRTIRTPITRFNFLRLNLSNMEDDSQHDYTKLRLVGIALKYRLLEMNQ